MQVFESIADRRIRAAQQEGFFDNLPGAGKPIPDLGQERAPGWWADRLVRREQSALAAEELDRELQDAMAPLWRSESEDLVRSRVEELNQLVDDYNRVTTWERRSPLDADDVVEKWRLVWRPARQQLGGRRAHRSVE